MSEPPGRQPPWQVGVVSGVHHRHERLYVVGVLRSRVQTNKECAWRPDAGVIQACDVDPGEPRLDGRDREECRALPNDPADPEWLPIQPRLPFVARRGRKAKADTQEMLNAIRCMTRNDSDWRMLPTNFGTWQTVSWWFRRLV